MRENPEIRATLDERYRYILVDEYQDTNLAQYAIVRALSIDDPNLAVTGDPDQSIYGWRGANLNNILDFEHDYPDVRVVRLEQNYRSTKRILRVADALIAYNQRRKEKELFTENDEGQRVRLVAYANQQDEAESIAARIADEVRAGRRRPRDFAIFYRVNALSRSARVRPARAGRAVSDGQRRWSSISARKSRTCWRICTCSTIRATTTRCCGSSTRRRAASARARSSGSASTRPRSGCRCWKRPARAG